MLEARPVLARHHKGSGRDVKGFVLARGTRLFARKSSNKRPLAASCGVGGRHVRVLFAPTISHAFVVLPYQVNRPTVRGTSNYKNLYQPRIIFIFAERGKFCDRVEYYSPHFLEAGVSFSASDRTYPGTGIWTGGRSERVLEANPAQQSDEELMTRVQAGEEVALGVLLERHARLVISIGARILRDPGEAQELVQDVFLQVYRKCQLFDPKKDNFRSWMVRMASNRAFDRREYLNVHRFYDDRNLDDFAEIMQSTVDVEYQTQIKQNEAVLRKAFEGLTQKQRLTMELFFFEGYTLREIGEKLNESVENIRHYYYRAIDRLRMSLGNQKGD